MIVAVLLPVACGGSDDTSAPGDLSSSTVGVTTEPSTTRPASTTPASTKPASTATLAPLTAVAELGYPRDLLDRGRVNIVLSRPSEEPLVLLDKQLVIDGFEPAAVEQRRTVVPPGGQRVAVQAAFGEVADCDAPLPLAAHLAVHYTAGDDPTEHAGSIVLDDTATLADIRARFCTARRVLAENEVVLGEPEIDGEAFTVDLAIHRRVGDADLVVHTVKGTVLFGVETPAPQSSPERALSAGTDELVLPLVFDVNRCDPHAVAETTRRHGLTVWIAVDGATPQPVDVDITSLVDDLDVILDRCRDRTAG